MPAEASSWIDIDKDLHRTTSLLTLDHVLKGIVPTKIKTVIIYSPSCNSKPKLLYFFCGTQKENYCIYCISTAHFHIMKMNGIWGCHFSKSKIPLNSGPYDYSALYSKSSRAI